jgi:hypothetical protein
MPIVYLIGVLLVIWLIMTIVEWLGKLFKELGVMFTNFIHAALTGGGLVITAIFVGFAIWAVYRFVSDPGRRFITDKAKRLEAYRQKIILHHEMKRKLTSEQQKAKARAFAAAAKLYDHTKMSLAGAKADETIEELRLDAELKIMNAQMDEIDRIVEQYASAETLINQSPDLSPEERIDLIKDIRDKINEKPSPA